MMPPDLMQVPVNPVRVIAVLKQRLAEEIAQNATLSAMLQEAQERERGMAVQLNEAQLKIAELMPAEVQAVNGKSPT